MPILKKNIMCKILSQKIAWDSVFLICSERIVDVGVKSVKVEHGIVKLAIYVLFKDFSFHTHQ